MTSSPVFDDGNDDRFPHGVTGRAQMELITDIQFGSHLAARGKERMERISEVQAWVVFGVLANALVQGALLIDKTGAAGTWFDREEKDVGAG